MTGNIRNTFGKSFIKYFLWVAMAAMVLGYIPIFFKKNDVGGVQDDWAFRINNNRVITQKEFLYKVHDHQTRIASWRSQYGEYADIYLMAAGLFDPKKVAFDELVRSTLILSAAHQSGMVLNADIIHHALLFPSALHHEIRELIPPHLLSSRGGIDHHALSHYLRKIGMSIGEFEYRLENIVMRSFFLNFVVATYATPRYQAHFDEVLEKSVYTYSILSVPTTSFIEQEKKNKSIDPALLQEFYNQENNASRRYYKEEKRSGTQWQVPLSHFSVVISDDAVAQHYAKESSKVKYLEVPARVQVRRILLKKPAESTAADAVRARAHELREKLLAQPDTFVKVAQEVSEDTNTANKGGLFPPFAKGEHERVFEQGAFTLVLPGDISSVLETKAGFELLQLVEKLPKKVKPLSAVKDEIKRHLLLEAQKAAFLKNIREAISSSDMNALSAFIAEMPAQKTNFEVQNAEKNQQERNKKLFQLAKVGDIGFVVSGDQGIILRLDAVEKEHLPTLAAIHDTVLHDYHTKIGVENAQKAVEQIRLLVAQKGISLAQLKKETLPAGAKTSVTPTLEHHDKKYEELAKEYSVDASLFTLLQKTGATLQETLADKILLIRLDAIATGTAQNSGRMKLWSAEKAGMATEAFVASLYRNAKIETNEAVFSRC